MSEAETLSDDDPEEDPFPSSESAKPEISYMDQWELERQKECMTEVKTWVHGSTIAIAFVTSLTLGLIVLLSDQRPYPDEMIVFASFLICLVVLVIWFILTDYGRVAIVGIYKLFPEGLLRWLITFIFGMIMLVTILIFIFRAVHI